MSALEFNELKRPVAPALLAEVADTYGTPCYVYLERTIRDRIRQFSTHLAGVPVKLLYAMKANYNPRILRIIKDEGLGLDVVSPGELELALRLGFDPTNVLFSANNMTDDEMHTAAAAGVRLNVGELSRLDRLGRAYPGSKVSVRLNPDAGAGHHRHVITAGEKSKFGIPVDQIDSIQHIAGEHALEIEGLHQHIGSGILNTDDFRAAIDILLEHAPKFPSIRFINFGGGLGVPYHPDDRPLDFDNFRVRIIEPLHSFLAEWPGTLEFSFEPGRYFVAEAGVLLVRVNTLKETSSRTFAGTDSGFNHLIRPTMYDSYHAIYNLTNTDGALRKYDITGNICESGDLFARDRLVQEIRENDVLAILDTGAYGFAMASEYNLRPLPPEVLIAADGTLCVARRRMTPLNLVNRILEETLETKAPSD